jgi:transposase
MSQNNPKPIRKKFSAQFKDQALALAEKQGVAKAAKDLGIDPAMLYSWRTKKRQGGDSIENQKLLQAETAKLKRDNARLAEENAFLKKAAAYFAKEQE